MNKDDILMTTFLIFLLALVLWFLINESKFYDCEKKCGLFDSFVWEHKDSCECFKEGKIIKLEEFIK